MTVPSFLEYDDFGRADRHYTYQNTTDITDFGYTYDKNSNITGISFDHRPSTPDNTYTYDDLNRLTGVEYLSDNQDTESFTMDDLGNRDSVTLRDGTTEDYHIDTLTNRYRGIDGPLGQWKFDEDSGETAYDSIGSNDGSITDDTSENSQWITGLFDGGLNFISTGGSSGTDGDYVQMADFSDEINNSDFSVSLWVCPDTVSVVQEMVLLGTAYNIHDLEFYQYYDDLRIRTNSSSTPVLTVPDIFTAQTWTHLCITAYYYDDGDEKVDLTVYVDGVLTETATSLVNTWNQYDLNIGAYPSRKWGFDGKMDEVQVFDTELTDAQAYALYKSETGNLVDYDNAGNLTSDKNGYLYTYDYENRIIKIEAGDGDATPAVIAVFEYDALGRRIEKYDAIADESVYYYYNAQWQVLAEYDGTNFGNRYVYGNTIDETLIMNDGTDDTYYAHNHLFSTVALMDESGTVVERYEYNAYGLVQVSTNDNTTTYDWFDTSTGKLDGNDTLYPASQVGNPYTFTGRRLDILNSGDLSLMYYRYRTYDTYTGRFMQHDPLGINPAGGKRNPFVIRKQCQNGINIYSYVGENPTRYSDFLGLNPCDAVDGAIDGIPSDIATDIVLEMVKILLEQSEDALRKKFPNTSQTLNIGNKAGDCKPGRVLMNKMTARLLKITKGQIISITGSEFDGEHILHVDETIVNVQKCRCPCAGNFEWKATASAKASTESSTPWVRIEDQSIGRIVQVSAKTYLEAEVDEYDCVWSLSPIMKTVCNIPW